MVDGSSRLLIYGNSQRVRQRVDDGSCTGHSFERDSRDQGMRTAPRTLGGGSLESLFYFSGAFMSDQTKCDRCCADLDPLRHRTDGEVTFSFDGLRTTATLCRECFDKIELFIREFDPK